MYFVERYNIYNNNNIWKRIVGARVRQRIIDVGGRRKYTHCWRRVLLRNSVVRASFMRGCARRFRRRGVLHGRVPIIDPRACFRRRPPLFFRAFSHARRLSLTAGQRGRPRPAYTPWCCRQLPWWWWVATACACGWCLFWRGRCRWRARYRLINVGGTAVTPDTRPLVPLDGSPFISFFSISAAGRTHAHLRVRIHAHILSSVLYAYAVRFCTHTTHIHVNARIPLWVCVRRSLSHFSFWRYAPPPLAFIIHTTTAIVLYVV